MVTSFGRIAAVYGDEPREAGLHAKAPWQLGDQDRQASEGLRASAARGDHGRQAQSRSRFVRRVARRRSGVVPASGREPRAGGSTALRAHIGEPERCDRPPRSVRAGLDRPETLGPRRADARGHERGRPAASRELGVDVLDIRLRRFNHPVEVRPAVFELIRSERRQVAAKTRAEGEAQYVTITSQADRTRDTILAAGRGRGPADPRQRRGRGDPRPQRGPCPRPQVFRVPSHARFVSLDSRRPNDRGVVVIESFAQALSQGPPAANGLRNLRPSRLLSTRRPASHEQDPGDRF